MSTRHRLPEEDAGQKTAVQQVAPEDSAAQLRRPGFDFRREQRPVRSLSWTQGAQRLHRREEALVHRDLLPSGVLSQLSRRPWSGSSGH